MATWPRQLRRRLAGVLRNVVDPRFDLVDEKLDRINHLVVTIEDEVQENRRQILASRHEAHVLMVTDIDAANEATALLGRSLADQRDLVDERLDHLDARLAALTEAVETLATSVGEVAAARAADQDTERAVG
jgi:hypothetical protein